MIKVATSDAFIATAEYMRLSEDLKIAVRQFASDQLKARFGIERPVENMDGITDGLFEEGFAALLIMEGVWGYANDAAHLAQLKQAEPLDHVGEFHPLLVS